MLPDFTMAGVKPGSRAPRYCSPVQQRQSTRVRGRLLCASPPSKLWVPIISPEPHDNSTSSSTPRFHTRKLRPWEFKKLALVCTFCKRQSWDLSADFPSTTTKATNHLFFSTCGTVKFLLFFKNNVQGLTSLSEVSVYLSSKIFIISSSELWFCFVRASNIAQITLWYSFSLYSFQLLTMNSPSWA